MYGVHLCNRIRRQAKGTVVLKRIYQLSLAAEAMSAAMGDVLKVPCGRMEIFDGKIGAK